MKRLLFFVLAFLCSHSAATEPYRLALNKQRLTMQPIVYARADGHGFGVQYARGNATGVGTGELAGAALGGFLGSLAGMVADDMRRAVPTPLSMRDAENLATFYDQAQAQSDLEHILAEKLAGVSVFTMPIVVRELAPGSESYPTAFDDDPVLVVELFLSLTTDYRALQVTAFGYIVSASAAAERPYGRHPGRFFLNRFDYISDPLPPPDTRTDAEIQADIEAVKAKFGRRLTSDQLSKKREALRLAKGKLTFEEARAPLLQAWAADDGARLKTEMQRGTTAVAEILAYDLDDLTAPRRPKKREYRETVSSQGAREVVRILVGEYAGALLSCPLNPGPDFCLLRERMDPRVARNPARATNLVLGCHGIAYADVRSPHPVRRLCRVEAPGSVCSAGQANTPTGCQDILMVKPKR